MLKQGKNDIAAMHVNGYTVLSIYMRGRLIWPIKKEEEEKIILSCYYNGYWIDEYPWTDDTPWTDNIN